MIRDFLKRKEWFFWVFIIGSFFITRLWKIFDFPLFGDEAFYVRHGYNLFKNPKDFLSFFKYNTQPLFLWLTASFLIFIKNPILATRLVSVFAGFLNLITLFFLVKKFFPKINKFFPLLFYVLLPFNLVYDRLALLESLTLLTISFALLAVFQLIKKPSISSLFLVTLAFLLGALTKQISIFGIILSVLFIADFLLFARDKGNKKKVVVYFLLASFIFVVLFILISLLAVGSFEDFLEHFIFIPGEHFMGKETAGLSIIFKNSKLNLFKLFIWLRAYLKTPISFLTFLAFLYALFHSKIEAWRRLVIWLVAIVIVEIPLTTIFYPRHLLPITIPIIILDSFFLTRLVQKLKMKTILIFFIFLILFLPCLIFNYKLLTSPESAAYALEDRFQYFDDWISGKGFDKIALFLKDESTDKKIVVFTETQDAAFIILRFNPLLKNQEIIFSEEEFLYNPIKKTPAEIFKNYQQQEKYIIRNCHQALPDDWPVKLVKTVTKSSFCEIRVYQLIEDEIKY